MAERLRRLSLRREVVRRIEEIITERPELGYTRISDFIADAVRRRVEGIVRPGEAHGIDRAITVLAEHEARRQAIETALKQCFDFEGDEFWRCVADFMKKEAEHA